MANEAIKNSLMKSLSGEGDGKSIQAAQLKQTIITNSLLSDMLNIQVKQFRLEEKKFAFEKKQLSKQKLAAQSSLIKQQRGPQPKTGKGSFLGKGFNWQDALLGLTVGGLMLGPAAADLLQRELEKAAEKARGRIQKAVDRTSTAIDKAYKRADRVWQRYTPSLPGLDDFRPRHLATGVTMARGKQASNFGRTVQGLNNAGRWGLNQGARALRGTGNLINRAGSGLVDQGRRIGAPRTRLTSDIMTPGRRFNDAKRFIGSSWDDALKLGKTAKFNTSTFFAGLGNAKDSTILSQFNRPFPNVARGGGSLADEIGGGFRLGRRIRDFNALDEVSKGFTKLGKSLKDIRINTFTKTMDGLGDFVKGLKGINANTVKNLARGGFGGLTQAGGRILQGGGRVIAGTPRAISGAKNLLSGGARVARGGGAFLKKVPLIGSLIASGFGAMEANTEEMERLRAENPTLSDEQINERLKDGRLQKNKNKIVSRSVGAGVGAGTGAVAGGALGSFLGPVGTVIGAAVGSWIGENIGKYLAEGFGAVFGGFNWGETFAPIMQPLRDLGQQLKDSFSFIMDAFGVGGDGKPAGENGFIPAMQKVGKVIGIIAKFLLKALVPMIQITIKVIQAVVWTLGKVIRGVIEVVKGILWGIWKMAEVSLGILKKIPVVGDLINKLGDMFSGKSLDAASAAVDNMDLSLPMGGGGKRSRGGIGGGNKWGIGGSNPVLSSGFGMRMHPVDNVMRKHQGLDVVMGTGNTAGTPLYLPDRAKIVDNRSESNGAGYGNSIYFTTLDDNITHMFGHMQKFASGLTIGQTYPAGTKVGTVGSSGKSTGPHLHWETATIAADVGRNGNSLVPATSLGYSLRDPFTKTSGAAVTDTESVSASSSTAKDGVSKAVIAPANLAGSTKKEFFDNVRANDPPSGQERKDYWKAARAEWKLRAAENRRGNKILSMEEIQRNQQSTMEKSLAALITMMASDNLSGGEGGNGGNGDQGMTAAGDVEYNTDAGFGDGGNVFAWDRNE